MELARSARIDDLGGAASWGSSNRWAREVLVGVLAEQTADWTAPLRALPLTQKLVSWMAQLDPTAEAP